MINVQYRVLSEPAEVWWAGFRSDTRRLQQSGWEIAAEEDVAQNRIRLVLRHQNMRLYALTDDVEYRYQQMAYSRGSPSLVFHVVAAAPKMEVHRANVDFAAFHQIDAMPQYIETEIKSLEDFRIFATPLVRTEEIIVEPQTVADMLERIREMQVPEQKRLREKQRLAAKREGMMADAAPQQTFHAQILSIGDYRKAA